MACLFSYVGQDGKHRGCLGVIPTRTNRLFAVVCPARPSRLKSVRASTGPGLLHVAFRKLRVVPTRSCPRAMSCHANQSHAFQEDLRGQCLSSDPHQAGQGGRAATTGRSSKQRRVKVLGPRRDPPSSEALFLKMSEGFSGGFQENGVARAWVSSPKVAQDKQRLSRGPSQREAGRCSLMCL